MYPFFISVMTNSHKLKEEHITCLFFSFLSTEMKILGEYYLLLCLYQQSVTIESTY